jgi:hypothetical protein
MMFLEPGSSTEDRPCSGFKWALLTAAYLGDTHTIKALLQRELDAGVPEGLLNTGLEIAASRGNFEAVVAFGESVDPNEQGSCEGHPSISGSAFGQACMAGHETIVNLFLQPCYGVEKKGPAYEFAILRAARGWGNGHDHLEIIRSLLAQGEFTNLRKLQREILDEACYWGREDVVRMVIKDVQVRWRGQTPLQIVTSEGYESIVQVHLAHRDEPGQ